MKCMKCGHENASGKFCTKCGSPLNANENEVAATVETTQQTVLQGGGQGQSQSNPQLEQAKRISKNYYTYFIDVLKQPLSQTNKVGQNQWVNSLITIALFSLLFPLTLYVSLGDLREWIESPFLNGIIKPFIGFAIFIVLMSAYTFGALKLSKLDVDFKVVLSRFGTLLVPVVVLFLLAFIMSLLDASLFAALLVFGFLIAIFAVPPFVLISFKKENNSGLDIFYSTLIIYLLAFLTIGLIGEFMFSIFLDMIEGIISSSLFDLF
ncbi:zinc ribbon domain-containing protein [Bacillus kwashiorkori]|uniref:zinc ribbon domain-containing protein n=1 Tax=Bacillus kwashiorkori TaxID=1522318 RepID=UPI0007842D0E|nr:zinc ribbon domain-containing protein [Bacillus kwashiorkori]